MSETKTRIGARAAGGTVGGHTDAAVGTEGGTDVTIMVCWECGESDDNVEMRELPNAAAGGAAVHRLLCDTCDRLRAERRQRQRALDYVYPVQIAADGSRTVLSQDEWERLNAQA